MLLFWALYDPEAESSLHRLTAFQYWRRQKRGLDPQGEANDYYPMYVDDDENSDEAVRVDFGADAMLFPQRLTALECKVHEVLARCLRVLESIEPYSTALAPGKPKSGKKRGRGGRPEINKEEVLKRRKLVEQANASGLKYREFEEQYQLKPGTISKYKADLKRREGRKRGESRKT